MKFDFNLNLSNKAKIIFIFSKHIFILLRLAQDSFDDDYINHYAPRHVYSSQSLRRHDAYTHNNQSPAATLGPAPVTTNPYTSGSVNYHQYTSASATAGPTLPQPSTPSTASSFPLSKLGFTHAPGYTSAIVSNSLYDSAALSASLSAAYPGSASVLANSVSAYPREKISSRLSGSVRRVLNEFEDDRNSRLSGYYQQQAPQTAPPRSGTHLSTVVSLDRSHPASRVSDVRSYSVKPETTVAASLREEDPSRYGSPSDAAFHHRHHQSNPFAFSSNVVMMTHETNSPVVFTSNKNNFGQYEEAPIEYNTLERSHDESEYRGTSANDYTIVDDNNTSIGRKIESRNSSVRKQFIRSGGRAATRCNRPLSTAAHVENRSHQVMF